MNLIGFSRRRSLTDDRAAHGNLWTERGAQDTERAVQRTGARAAPPNLLDTIMSSVVRTEMRQSSGFDVMAEERNRVPQYVLRRDEEARARKAVLAGEAPEQPPEQSSPPAPELGPARPSPNAPVVRSVAEAVARVRGALQGRVAEAVVAPVTYEEWPCYNCGRLRVLEDSRHGQFVCDECGGVQYRLNPRAINGTHNCRAQDDETTRAETPYAQEGPLVCSADERRRDMYRRFQQNGVTAQRVHQPDLAAAQERLVQERIAEAVRSDCEAQGGGSALSALDNFQRAVRAIVDPDESEVVLQLDGQMQRTLQLRAADIFRLAQTHCVCCRRFRAGSLCPYAFERANAKALAAVVVLELLRRQQSESHSRTERMYLERAIPEACQQLLGSRKLPAAAESMLSATRTLADGTLPPDCAQAPAEPGAPKSPAAPRPGPADPAAAPEPPPPRLFRPRGTLSDVPRVGIGALGHLGPLRAREPERDCQTDSDPGDCGAALDDGCDTRSVTSGTSLGGSRELASPLMGLQLGGNRSLSSLSDTVSGAASATRAPPYDQAAVGRCIGMLFGSLRRFGRQPIMAQTAAVALAGHSQVRAAMEAQPGLTERLSGAQLAALERLRRAPTKTVAGAILLLELRRSEERKITGSPLKKQRSQEDASASGAEVADTAAELGAQERAPESPYMTALRAEIALESADLELGVQVLCELTEPGRAGAP